MFFDLFFGSDYENRRFRDRKKHGVRKSGASKRQEKKKQRRRAARRQKPRQSWFSKIQQFLESARKAWVEKKAKPIKIYLAFGDWNLRGLCGMKTDAFPRSRLAKHAEKEARSGRE